MQSKQLNVKLMPELERKIELIARILHVPKVEWVRNVLAYEVRKELEEHKSFIAMEYTKGNISRKELVKILGEKIVRDVNFIMEKTKEDLKAARKLIKK